LRLAGLGFLGGGISASPANETRLGLMEEGRDPRSGNRRDRQKALATSMMLVQARKRLVLYPYSRLRRIAGVVG
jgi:hypothetical protein